MNFFTGKDDYKAGGILKGSLLKGTSVALCLAMGLSIAGCGKSKTDAVKTISADSAYFSVDKLNYYNPAEGDESNLISVVPVNDQIAMLISVNNYSNLNTGSELYRAKEAAAAAAGGAVAAETVAEETVAAEAVSAEASSEETAAAETSAANTGADTAAADNSGTDAAASDGAATDETMVISDGTTDPNAYTPVPAKYIVLFYDNQGTLISQADLSSNFAADSYVMSMTCSPDGHLLIFVQSYDSVTYEASYLLYTFDTKGTRVGEPLALSFDSGNSPNQMAADKDGNIYFSGYGEKGAVISVFDSKGKPLFDISNGTENLNGTLYQIGGTMYADGYQNNDEEYKYVFYPIDSAGKKLGEPVDMTDLAGMGGSGFYVGSDGLYYSDSIGVYSLDMETKAKTPILLWKDTDLENNMNGNQKVVVFSADKLMVMNTTYMQSGMETTVSLLSREAKNPNAGKKIITVAGVGITYDSSVSTAVYNFNTTNPDYRIEIHDYMADQMINSEEDYNKVINTMNMEILSGDGPDIVYGSYQSFENYEAKGLLVDLYTLIDKDTTFNKADYIPSIFKVCENDGHLYQIGTSFAVQGFVGSKDVIGDRTGWTVDEFNEMAASLPEDVAPLANQTQSSLLTNSLYASMDAFVNNTTSEVTFDTPAFYQLLAYAKTYGMPDENQDGQYVDEQTMLQNGELALGSCYISDPSSYSQYVTLLGGPVSITGFPSSDKRGPMCYMNTILAISSESGSQKAAWEFVKSFLSKDAQDKISENYQIPILTSAFEAQIDKAMHPDENSGGNIVYDKMGQVTAMTEETAQAYRDLVYGLDTLASYDQEIVNIIMEEVPEYFDGQKSDKAVAALIQDRVQTLVNERQ